jgi:hypothetical protein
MYAMAVETTVKIEPALLTIPQVCAYLNIARATFYKINTCRKILYSRVELMDWLNANPRCPHRKQWQVMKGQKQ